MPALSYLKLSRLLACQGTQVVYGVLKPEDLESATDVMAVEDQESLTLRFSRVDETGGERHIAQLSNLFTSQLKAGRVITVVWDDGSFDEWRVGPVIQGRGEKGLITVQCVPLWLDLVERADSASGMGWVSDLSSSGIRNFDYEIDHQTPAAIWSARVIPACPSWVTAGTIDPTYVIPNLSVSRITPGALALLVRDTLRNVDVACEVRLRRNGTTDYKLDLVTQIGSAAATPVFHPSTSLVSLQQKSDPTLQATRVLLKGGTAPDGLPGQWGIARWRGAAPSGNDIALTDRNGGASPIAFDGQFYNGPGFTTPYYLLRVKTGRTFPITWSLANGGIVTLGGGVSNIAADEDFELRLGEPLTNTRTTTTRYAVSVVPDGTHITMAVSAPITADGQYIDWYARVWTLGAGGTIVTTTRITGSVAATDVIAVDSSAGVTNAHFVEFVQLDGAGEVMSYVDHPTYSEPDEAGYGIKVMELAKPMIGVAQLCPNAWMRAWSNGSNPPDGWAIATTGTITTARNSTAAYTRYGGYSWQFSHPGNAVATLSFRTPPVYPNWTPALVYLSCRASVYFTTYAATTAFIPYSQLTVYALTATGALGAQLGRGEIQPITGGPLAAGVVAVDIGAWIEIKIEGITLGPATAPYGVVAVWEPMAGSTDHNVVGYLDVIEFYPFITCPSDTFEFGDATALEQSGNNQLRQVATPPLYYTFGVLDLERAFPSEYPRLALSLGGNVRAADIDYGIDATVRLLKRTRNLLDPSKTELTLANRPTLLTNVQAAGAATQQRVIAAVVAGTTTLPGPAFTPLTAATTLTDGAEIATPLAGAPIVTLPTGPADSGTAVTFVPANPTTTPQTVVTSGTPPSRQRKITLL